MKTQMKFIGAGAFAVIAMVMAFSFQNCAKSKFTDPDPVHTLVVQGLCQICDDDAGTGLSCRTNQTSAFASCAYESCRPGFMASGTRCEPVVCEPGAVANCTVDHGEGRKTCNQDRRGYGACVAIACETGFQLSNGACQPIPAVCTGNSHRDCSTDSTIATETCNSQGNAYGACVHEGCKPGYNKDNAESCQPNSCEPNTITPCTIGAGSGFKTCNSKGSAWGACRINGCGAGYTLVDGVCVIQSCAPGTKTACEFDDGYGEKICNNTGLDHGPCALTECKPGKSLEDGKCVQQVCTPSSQETCSEDGGTGVKYCYENGRGHGPCQLKTCDQGFNLENGLCVRGNSCTAGETFACTTGHGTGIRTCSSTDKLLGPCVANQCDAGYTLVTQGAATLCHKEQ